MFTRLQRHFDERSRSKELKKQFTAVYQENFWGGTESRSGPGSVRNSPWVTISKEAIERAVRDYDIRSVNDIPCGDFNWMPDLLKLLPQVRYTGFDIVEAAVKENKRKFSEYDFRVFDITVSVPPMADLVFCKDLLNHLSENDIHRALANIRRSGAKYLLASNNPGFENVELNVKNGNSRHVDITTTPFNVPPPDWTAGDYLGFWRLAAWN